MTDKVLLQWARKIRFFAFDSDGVLFPNTVWEGVEIGGAKVKPKIRTYYDGQGMSLVRALGIRVCIITNEKDANAAGVRATVEKWNNLPSTKKPLSEGGWPPIELFEGCGGPRKLSTLEAWLAKHGGTLKECGAMGDDLVDADMLRAVEFPVSPVSAEKVIRDMCLYVTARNGGEGAVRDLANFLVEAHGLNPLEMPFE